MGFDGVVLFQPNVRMMRDHWVKRGIKRVLSVPGKLLGRVTSIGKGGYTTLDYNRAWHALTRREPEGEDWFPCVMPQWDNSARRTRGGATIFVNSMPESYEEWLRHSISRVAGRPPDHRLVFLNAWNEWAEGCHLEPDLKFGRSYLEATRRAVSKS
jgi:hypothetical protein